MVDKSQYPVQGGSAQPVFIINADSDAEPVLIYGLNSSGENVAYTIDRTRAMPTIEFEHHSVHEGRHYFYTDTVTLANEGTQEYLILSPTHVAGPVFADKVHFHFNGEGSAITKFELFEDTTKVGSSEETVFNSNRNSANVSGSKVYKGATGDGDGTLIKEFHGGSSSQQARSGDTGKSVEEIVLKVNTKYLFRITSGTASNLCNVYFTWYEITASS